MVGRGLCILYASTQERRKEHGAAAEAKKLQFYLGHSRERQWRKKHKKIIIFVFFFLQSKLTDKQNVLYNLTVIISPKTQASRIQVQDGQKTITN